MPILALSSSDYAALTRSIQDKSLALGLQQVGIADINLDVAEGRLLEWLKQGCHGDMNFMTHHGQRRSRPADLIPGTLRVITARLDYLSRPIAEQVLRLADPNLGYIACYALGRDYHRLLRLRLQQLARHIGSIVGAFNYRVYVDSAPVMEKPLAAKAGLGWIGKHTNLISRQAGSWFFLGEIYTDLPLPVTAPVTGHCGSCRACMDACPTGAIIAPYKLDARRCIAYLTIESRDSIPEHLRPLLGNRIFGCDDCQHVCPWNRFAQLTPEADFRPRAHLARAHLTELFAWSEAEFLHYTEGSALRRLGWQRWLRNIAVALGNAPYDPCILAALYSRVDCQDAVVREHVQWAIAQHRDGSNHLSLSPPLGGDNGDRFAQSAPTKCPQ